MRVSVNALFTWSRDLSTIGSLLSQPNKMTTYGICLCYCVCIPMARSVAVSLGPHGELWHGPEFLAASHLPTDQAGSKRRRPAGNLPAGGEYAAIGATCIQWRLLAPSGCQVGHLLHFSVSVGSIIFLFWNFFCVKQVTCPANCFRKWRNKCVFLALTYFLFSKFIFSSSHSSVRSNSFLDDDSISLFPSYEVRSQDLSNKKNSRRI